MCPAARQEPLDIPAPLRRCVVDEFALFASLAPLLVADLACDYISSIVASDAAPEYGFGVSVASASKELLFELGRLSERRGDFIRFDRTHDEAAEEEKPRLGNAHRLELRRCDFRHVISQRARRIEHSGVLELNGALILIKWLGRSVRNHGKRVLTLLDAKAVLGALQKGRSSLRKLGHLLQRTAAHLIGCDITPRLLYVPTEDMLADAPSRGLRNRPGRRRVLRPKGYSKVDRCLHKQITRYDRAMRVLREQFGSSVSDSTSSSS